MLDFSGSMPPAGQLRYIGKNCIFMSLKRSQGPSIIIYSLWFDDIDEVLSHPSALSPKIP